MNEYRRIYVPLSREEFVTLQDAASNEFRHPRDQARYLLRLALGLVEQPNQEVLQPPETRNRGAMDCDPQRAAVAP